jgi:hypothetical protein
MGDRDKGRKGGHILLIFSVLLRLTSYTILFVLGPLCINFVAFVVKF